MVVTKLTGTIDNARITLDAAEIPNLDTAKITTGTMADARISSSSVVQHATATDLTPVRQDIASLALQSAVGDNKVAHNLPNSFIDQFEDDSGIGTETDGDRNSNEYWSTSSQSAAEPTKNAFNQAPYSDDLTVTHDGPGALTAANAIDGSSSSGGTNFIFANYVSSLPIAVTVDFGSGNAYVLDNYYMLSWTDQNGPYFGEHNVKASNDASTWTTLKSSTTAVTGTTQFTFTNTTAYRYYKATLVTHGGGLGHVAWADWSGYGSDLRYGSSNATGTLIGNANVPQTAQTKVSGIINYKDADGTTTIGTDLKIYFTCNGGTNWTEVPTYTAVTPVFSTGVKMVRLAETTCTQGSDVRYKAVFANQSSGSKVTELHGIGINY